MKTTKKPTKAQILKRIDECIEHLRAADEIIDWLITVEAWKTLGYKDLVELFIKHFKGTGIATSAVKKRVVYELLEQGNLTQAEIANVVGYATQKQTNHKGEISTSVSSLNRQRIAGVPIDNAVTASSSTHIRRNIAKHGYKHRHSPLKQTALISVEVPDKVVAGLEALVGERYPYRSDVIKAALTEFLKKHKKL